MKNYEATEQAYKNGYEKGYADGIREAAEVVRCKDCDYYEYGKCRFWNAEIHPDNFCSWAEKRPE